VWLRDDDLVAEAIEAFERDRADLLSPAANTADQDAAALGLLTAAGTLALLGMEDFVRELGFRVERVGGLLRAAATRLDASSLDHVATDLIGLAPALELSQGEDRELLVERVRAGLSERDRFDILDRGARALLGSDDGLGATQRAALERFERTLRPHLWRLVPMNEVRETAVAWMAPTERARFWWWSQGADVPPDALDHLSDSPMLLACFPEGAGAIAGLLSRLRKGHEQFVAAARSERAARITVLATAASRAPVGAPAPAEPLRLAADRGTTRQGLIGALFTDLRGQTRGYRGLIEVRFSEVAGRSEPSISRSLELVRPDVERAIEIALAHAKRWLDPFLPPPPRASWEIDLRLDYEGQVEAGKGHSIGLPVALAALGAHMGWVAADSVVATGELADDAGLRAVEGIAAKVGALAGEPVSLLVLPHNQGAEASASGYTGKIVEAEDLDTAVAAVFAKNLRRIWVRALDWFSGPLTDGLPRGWESATPVLLPDRVPDVSDALATVKRAVEDEAATAPGAIVQLIVAGPVSLGAALGVVLSQRSVAARIRVVFVQPPDKGKGGAAWWDNRSEAKT
jgi:hypothetical protein